MTKKTEKFCYLCDNILTASNTSKEHVIPDCIGGKLKSPILHIRCNNDAGANIDALAFEELKFYANFLNHKRDSRKKNQDVEFLFDGKPVKRAADGVLHSISIKKTEDGVLRMQSFHTPNSEQEKQNIKQFEKHIKNCGTKYQWTSEKTGEVIQNLKDELQNGSTIINNPGLIHSFKFNKDGLLFLGLLKIAIGYCIHSECRKKYVEQAIQILKSKNFKENHQKINYYYPDNLYPKDSIYHSLILKGDDKNNLLYCLISIYGVINVFVLLNDNYAGEGFLSAYFYDLRNEKEINHEISLPKIDRDNIRKILSTDNDYADSLKKAIGSFMDFFVRYPDEKTYEAMEQVYKNTINEITSESKEILAEDVFKERFKEKLSHNLSSLKELKLFKISQIQDVIKIQEAANLIHYRSYMEALFPTITQNIVGNIFDKLLSEDINFLKNPKKFKVDFIDTFTAIRTDNEVVNSLLKEKQVWFLPQLEKTIDGLLEMLKTKNFT